VPPFCGIVGPDLHGCAALELDQTRDDGKRGKDCRHRVGEGDAAQNRGAPRDE
jgi:hypothetical protein